MDFNNLVEKEQILTYHGYYYFEEHSPLIMYENCNRLMIHVRRDIKLREYDEVDDSVFDIIMRDSTELEERLNALRKQWNDIVLYYKQRKMDKQLQQLEKDFE